MSRPILSQWSKSDLILYKNFIIEQLNIYEGKVDCLFPVEKAPNIHQF